MPTVTPTYDPALARVRVAVTGLGASTRRNLARDPSATAMTRVVGMGSAGRTAATDAAFGHDGASSAKFTLTSTGSAGARFSVNATTDPIAAGDTVRWSVWVYATRAVNWQPYWERVDGVYRGGPGGSNVAVAANTWTKITGSYAFDANTATDVGTTHGFGALASSGLLSGDIYWFDEALIEKGVAALGAYFSGATPDVGAAIDYAWTGTANDSTSTEATAAATSVTVDRSTNGTAWTVVRGAAAVVPSANAVTVDDYEFPDGVLVTYRARGYTAGALGSTTTGTITTGMAGVWLKSVTRPFLNRAVTVTDFGDVTTPSRGSVVDVLGRRLPVAVSGVRGSRAFDLVLRAADADAVEQLALMLSFGDTMFLHVPANCPLPSGGHFHVGDVTERRPPKHDSFARYFTLPLIEVDAPDAGIVGATITWAGVVSAYATWSAVTTAKASWLALNESISAPADEVVG